MASLFKLIKRAFGHEPPLHPIDRQMAKRWIKQRLVNVYPHLRNNPEALERAYRTLNLEPRENSNPNEPDTIFEMELPGPEPEP